MVPLDEIKGRKTVNEPRLRSFRTVESCGGERSHEIEKLSITAGLLLVVLILILMAGGNLAFAATITGTVLYEGKVPKLKAITMDADPICARKHSEKVRVEVLVLGEGQTMANVFVHVKSGLPQKTYPTPTDPVVVDQVGCMYSPHVFGIRTDQTLTILNSDGTLHNIHAMPKVNRAFNIAMPETKTTANKVFTKQEFMFPIKCDVHPWMGAWCAVMSHPFFATTGKDGKFTIEGLEAGTYEIEAWHERLGTRTATVSVTTDETKTVDFSISIPSK